MLGRSDAKDRVLGWETRSGLPCPLSLSAPQEGIGSQYGKALSWAGSSCPKPRAEQKGKGLKEKWPVPRFPEAGRWLGLGDLAPHPLPHGTNQVP